MQKPDKYNSLLEFLATVASALFLIAMFLKFMFF